MINNSTWAIKQKGPKLKDDILPSDVGIMDFHDWKTPTDYDFEVLEKIHSPFACQGPTTQLSVPSQVTNEPGNDLGTKDYPRLQRQGRRGHGFGVGHFEALLS